MTKENKILSPFFQPPKAENLKTKQNEEEMKLCNDLQAVLEKHKVLDFIVLGRTGERMFGNAMMSNDTETKLFITNMKKTFDIVINAIWKKP